MMMHSVAFFGTATLKATVIFAAAFLLAFVLRRASASARYFVWTSAFATTLAIPLLSLSVRPWNVALAAPAVAACLASHTSLAPGASAVARPDYIGWWLIAIWLCGAAVVL